MIETLYTRQVGDQVHYVKEQLLKVVPAAEFHEKMASKKGLLTPILPRTGDGTVLYHKTGDKSLVVFEQSPRTRTVTWKNAQQNYSPVIDDRGRNTGSSRWVGPCRFSLPLPYVIFFIRFKNDVAVWNDNCQVFFRNTPVQSLDDTLCISAVPNVSQTHQMICTGNVTVDGSTLAHKAASFCENFWSSEFNKDLNENWKFYGRKNPEYFAFPELWEKAGRDDPAFAIKYPWQIVSTVKDQLLK